MVAARGTAWILAAAIAAASGCARDPSGAEALPALRALDDAHAADFVQAFNEAQDHPRYIVALSPS